MFVEFEVELYSLAALEFLSFGFQTDMVLKQ